MAVSLMLVQVVKGCGTRVPAPLRVSGQGHFPMQQGMIRNGGSHKTTYGTQI